MGRLEDLLAAKLMDSLGPEMQRELAIEYVRDKVRIDEYKVSSAAADILADECKKVVESHRDDITEAVNEAVDKLLADKDFVAKAVHNRLLRWIARDILDNLFG